MLVVKIETQNKLPFFSSFPFFPTTNFNKVTWYLYTKGQEQSVLRSKADRNNKVKNDSYAEVGKTRFNRHYVLIELKVLAFDVKI